MGRFRTTAHGALDSHNEHGLDLLSDKAQDITPTVAPDLNPEQVALPKDGGVDPAPLAAHSSVVEPNIGLTSVKACNPGPPDSYLVVGPGPHTLEPAGPSCAPVLALWRHAELIKVSIFVRRLWAELCPA